MGDIKQEVIGKWPSIFSHLGISVGTGKHQSCPVRGCGGTDRFRFIDKNGTGSFYCNQCNPHAGDGWALLMKVLGIDFKEACQEIEKIIGVVKPMKHQDEPKISPELLRKIFEESHIVRKGDAAAKYLIKRGLSGGSKELRCTAKCWEPETKQEQRAMLARFMSFDNEMITIHRTFIDNDGNKLNIDKPKKLLPTLKPMAGGAVRLFDHDGQLGIAEGIETALAVHECYKIPCWAALSAPLLEGFKPPVTVKELIIFADHDTNFTGQKAAFSLANRVSLQGEIRVEVEIPKRSGEDFLDELNRIKELK